MPLSFSAVGGAHFTVLTGLTPAGFPKDCNLGMEKDGLLYSLRMLREEYIIVVRIKE